MKVFLSTVGCRLNQSEIEQIAAQLRSLGHVLVDSPQTADWVIVNTCTVTARAASDSRQVIRQAGRQGNSRIVVTGCWATLEPQAAASLPGVTKVVSNWEKDDLVRSLFGIAENGVLAVSKMARVPIPGPRRRTRAFIKAQDGCDNHCTFCVTRIARGVSRSRPAEKVIRDIQAAAEGGSKEAVLTGVQLGSWGRDFDPPQRLHDLIERVLEETEIPRLRLSSLEAWDLDESFFALWENARLCRHLHLPLQSGSDDVLRRMGRKTTTEQFARLVQTARSVIPSVSITTDVIVGFPGETDKDFEQSLAFVRQLGFSGGHVFSYSLRPQTPAAQLTDQVPFSIRKVRSAQMRAAFSELSIQYRRGLLGSTCVVLWESGHRMENSRWRMRGLTDHYVPVFADMGENLLNKMTAVQLIALCSQGVLGEVIPAE
ncbi:MAG: tRNA (N(6)-L-threonylcarbamoyladenosine(37)-C(2))-methylthiotransferase MtaB [Anaerolineae bacterium]|nr:tRNA (N(6)-L-threonylcarbamoyladenosine(37)-C(2))-methylthiotransferase MtaB [Anaerolineae bacterium]